VGSRCVDRDGPSEAESKKGGRDQRSDITDPHASKIVKLGAPCNYGTTRGQADYVLTREQPSKPFRSRSRFFFVLESFHPARANECAATRGFLMKQRVGWRNAQRGLEAMLALVELEVAQRTDRHDNILPHRVPLDTCSPAHT